MFRRKPVSLATYEEPGIKKTPSQSEARKQAPAEKMAPPCSIYSHLTDPFHSPLGSEVLGTGRSAARLGGVNQMHQIQGWRERSRARLPPSFLTIAHDCLCHRPAFLPTNNPPRPWTTTASSLNGPAMAQANGALFTACERCNKWQLQKP